MKSKFSKTLRCFKCGDEYECFYDSGELCDACRELNQRGKLFDQIEKIVTEKGIGWNGLIECYPEEIMRDIRKAFDHEKSEATL